jgi:RNA polymerase sigma factor (sigma-70 family)
MGSEISDADALRRSLAEPTAFGLVYERHMPRVLRYLRRRVGDGIAEDLTAEVFVRAFRGRAKYGVQHETALPWLLGIASNLIGDHRRAERRRLATLAKLVGEVDEGADLAVTDGLSPRLVGELRRLPAADRDALLLVAWGELSYEETARALGVPIGTVRSRIARARQRLSGERSARDAGRQADVLTNGENHA